MSSSQSARPPTRLGFLGFGEAASLFAAGLSRAGLDGICAYDIAVHGGPGETLLHARAADAGVRLIPGCEAFQSVDVVFAMVQPAAALDAARKAAAHLRPGCIFADFSSASPAIKTAAAMVVEAGGASYVDLGIVGSVPDSGHRVATVASGARAEAFRDLFVPYGMNVAVIGETVGAAAGLKLIRSILAKGLEALYVEALTVAERSGVRESVLDTFCGFLDARSARETATLLMRSHLVHAARRADEVRMSRDMVVEAGLEPVMTDAIVRIMEQTVRAGIPGRIAGGAPESLPDSLEAALTILTEGLPDGRDREPK